ncbi:MAG: sigma-70 family RNA polymerase sigma factor [Cyclobacteriaceae bacterium]|nr:sigma-70 family RNA polymerase sigma factor [Cyclobacteriaceae bacterium]
MTLVKGFFLNSSTYHQTEKEIDREQKIIKLCKENPRYFAPIYEKYYDAIFVFIYKRVADEYICADLTSIVFYKSLKNINKYKFQGLPFSSWLYRIALNEVNQYFRDKKTAQRVVCLDKGHLVHLFEEIEIDNDGYETEKTVAKLLESLSEQDLQFLELRFFESRSFKEIGDLLGTTEGNAKIKTYRILRKLKEVAVKSAY